MRRKYLGLFVFLAPAILVAPVVLAGRAFFYGTTLLQFHPWRVAALEALGAGSLPLWNPLSGMGAPLLANYQSAFLYPPTWLLLLLGAIGGEAVMAWGQGLLVLGHLAVAGWGMMALARELRLPLMPQVVAGLAYGLSGYLVARSHFLSINAATAWAPWLLLGVERLAGGGGRRAALPLAGWTALLLLAGHAQTAWYVLIFAAAWFIFRLYYPNTAAHSQSTEPEAADSAGPTRVARLTLFAAALLWGAALAAAQLAPTAELLLQSQRAGGADETFVMTYSLWPWRLLGLFFPGLFGSPATGNFWGYGNYWEDALYMGLLPVLLAVRAVFQRGRAVRKGEVRFLAAATGIAILLALGNNTPVFPFLYRHVPTFDLFQAPTRYTLWAMLSLSLLAGIGAQEWAAGISILSRRRAARGSAVALAFALAGAAALLFLPEIEPSFGRAALTAGLIGAGAAALGLARRRGPGWQTLVAGLVALDLLIAGWGLNPGADLALYSAGFQSPEASRVRNSGGRLFLPAQDEYDLTFDRFFRFDTFAADRSLLRPSLLPNLNLLDGAPSVNQFDPLQPARYVEWMDELEAAPPPVQNLMLAEMSVAMVETYDSARNALRFQPLDFEPRLAWFSCAFAAADAMQARSLALDRLPDDLPRLAVEEAAAGDGPLCAGAAPAAAAGTAAWVSDSAGEQVIEVQAPAEGWILVRDTFYPGWQVEVDGTAAAIYPANGLFRAVPIPEGVHTVRFFYNPGSFRVGLAISLAGLALYAWMWARERGAAG